MGVESGLGGSTGLESERNVNSEVEGGEEHCTEIATDAESEVKDEEEDGEEESSEDGSDEEVDEECQRPPIDNRWHFPPHLFIQVDENSFRRIDPPLDIPEHEEISENEGSDDDSGGSSDFEIPRVSIFPYNAEYHQERDFPHIMAWCAGLDPPPAPNL